MIAAAGSAARTRRRWIVLAAAAIAAGAAVSHWQGWKERRRQAVLTEDRDAVDLFFRQTLPDSQGQVFRFEQLRGKPVVINFWATWCGPCRAEMPEFVKLHDAGSDVVILEVNAQEALEVIRPFAEEFGMRMPVLVDEVGAVRQLYGVRAMPTTLFIDAKGIIQARWAGLLTGDQLDQFAALIQAK